MLHHKTEYSTDGGLTWLSSVADETTGTGKTLTISGLSAGSYQVRLRITPLSGTDLTPVVSDPVTLNVAAQGYTEAVTALVNAGASASDTQTMVEALQSSASVSNSLTDLAGKLESVSTSINAATTVQDAVAMVEQLIASATAVITSNGAAAMGDSVSTAGAAVVTASDLKAIQEQTSSAGAAVVTVSDLMTLSEQLMATVSAVASETDTYTPGVTTPATPTGVSASNSPAEITISWSAVSGATLYKIYSCPGNSYDARQIVASNIAPLNGNTGTQSYTIASGLTSGTTYYYCVEADNAVGSSLLSAIVSAAAAAVVNFNIVVQSGSLNAMINGISKASGTYAYSGSSITAAITSGGGAGANDNDNGSGGTGSGIGNNILSSSSTLFFYVLPGANPSSWGSNPSFGLSASPVPDIAGSLFSSTGVSVTSQGSANNGTSGAQDGDGRPGYTATGNFSPINGATYYVYVGGGGTNSDDPSLNGGDGSVSITI